MSTGRVTPPRSNGRSHHGLSHVHSHGHHHQDHSRRSQHDFAQGADWEKHRDRITELYRDQGLHLKQVQKIMQEQHNFFASQRMYKTRISKWAIDKNLKAKDVATILSVQQHRKEMGKKSKFTIRGRDIDFARVEQYLKRDPTLTRRSQGADLTAEDLQNRMDAAGITCRTPSPTPPSSPSPSGHFGFTHHPQQNVSFPPDMYFGRNTHTHMSHDHYFQGRPFQPHGSYAQNANHQFSTLPSTTIPILPSHAPMHVATTASSFPSLNSTLSTAPFTTANAGSTIPSLSLPASSLPYMPLHTAHSMSSIDQQRTLPSQYDARRNSIANPVSMLSVPQGGQSNPNQSNLNVSPYLSGASPGQSSATSSLSARSSYTPTPQIPTLFASSSPLTDPVLENKLVHLARGYFGQAIRGKQWVQRIIGTGSLVTASSKENGVDTAGEITTWGRELRVGRRLIGDGIIDKGFTSVHQSMDRLQQHLQKEDPSLLFYLLYSTAFGTKCPLDQPRNGRDSTAELRGVGMKLGIHIKSLTSIVLGQQHPINQMIQLLVAEDGRIRSPAHMAALPIPLMVMRDLYAEYDLASADSEATAQIQRLAYLLSLGRPATDGDAVETEREELTARLQDSPNMHTKLNFFVAYLQYLTDLALQQENERKASEGVNWSGGDVTMGGVPVPTTSPSGISSLTPSYSSTSDGAATPDSSYTTSMSTATARPHVVPIIVGMHNQGQNMTGTSTSNTQPPTSSGSPSSSLPSSPVAGVSSAMIPQPPTTMTTPRTILSNGQSRQQSQGHSAHDSPYTLQPSAYPPVPSPYHQHPSTKLPGMSMASGHDMPMGGQTMAGQPHAGQPLTAGGMNNTGSMTWELGDAANVNWV